MTMYTLRKLENLEEEIEIVELRILEAIWTIERSLESQANILTEVKTQLNEIKDLSAKPHLKKVSSVESLNKLT